MTSVNGVVKINSFLIPILIIFIIIIGVINVNTINLNNLGEYITQKNKYGWLLSSVLYASYNSILLIPVLVTLKKYINNKKTIVISTIIGGAIICVLAIIIYLLLARVDIDINTLEMPAVYAISNFFYGFKNIYAFIILASIYTTAISIGVSVLENITKDSKLYKQIAAFICITGILVSGIGFSNLINLLYPIFGYLGLVQIFALIRKRANN